MSAILPGLGQVYNRKFWKVPVIYAGLGGFYYMFSINNDQYNFYRRNLIGENTTPYDKGQLQTQKEDYKKDRDFAALGMAVFYVLNIVDANVDAHLKTFDVSDDLSMRIEPWQNIFFTGLGYRAAAGISLKLNIR